MTQTIHSTVPQPGRRQLLLGGSVAALAAAAGATVRSALAGEPAEAPALPLAADVRQFGAVGDGNHDDRQVDGRAIGSRDSSILVAHRIAPGLVLLLMGPLLTANKVSACTKRLAHGRFSRGGSETCCCRRLSCIHSILCL